MREAITETRPLVLDRLLKIEANFFAVTEWTPLATEAAKKEVVKRRRHANVSKSGFVSSMKDESKVNQRDVLIDEGKQADIEALGDCLRALADGQVLGDISLTIVLYDKDRSTVDLSAAIGREYEGQCEILCFGSHPSWEIVQARFMELRNLL
jgi:hypothetical protein